MGQVTMGMRQVMDTRAALRAGIISEAVDAKFPGGVPEGMTP